MTLGAGGFTYKRISDYLANWERPELLRPTKSEQQRPTDKMQLVARAMVRGQGKTEGYHERVIPVAHKTKMAMLNRDAAQGLGQLAKDRIDQVSKVQRILSHAIQVFAARGDESKVSQEHRNLVRPWLNRLDAIVDKDFFEHLQVEFDREENDREDIRNRWLKDSVIENARVLLRDAEDSLPCPAINRYRARVNADGLFEGRIRGRDGFPGLLDNQGGEE